MARTESTQNVSFAVLVAAYVFVCAAVPSAQASSALTSGASYDGRQCAISIVSSLSAAPVKYKKQARIDSNGAAFVAALSHPECGSFPENNSTITRYDQSTDALSCARASTGAMTRRFLAAS